MRALPLLLLAGLSACATTRPPALARVTTVQEGRAYSGFSLAPTRCQQRPFFPRHFFTK